MTAISSSCRSDRKAQRFALAACLLSIAVLVGFTVSLAPGLANAQSADLQRQIDRLRRDLGELQQDFYRGGGGTTATSSGGSYTPDQAARIDQRLADLDAQLRQITGQTEELGYRLDRLDQRFEQFVKGVELRLARLEGNPLPEGEAPATVSELDEEAKAELAATSTGGVLSTRPSQDSGPKVIGSVSAADVERMQAQGAAAVPSSEARDENLTETQTAAVSTGDPQADYDRIMVLLSQNNLAAAEPELQEFISAHSDHALAGNAKYWLGETYYARGRYKEAAIAFGEGFQEYPDSPKASHNLLKLAKSLSALGQNDNACAMLGELKTRFPNAEASISQEATREDQRLGCK